MDFGHKQPKSRTISLLGLNPLNFNRGLAVEVHELYVDVYEVTNPSFFFWLN